MQLQKTDTASDMEVCGNTGASAPSRIAAKLGVSPKRQREEDVVNKVDGGREPRDTELQREQRSPDNSARAAKRRRRLSRKARRLQKRFDAASASVIARTSQKQSPSKSSGALKPESSLAGYTRDWKRKKVLDFNKFPKVRLFFCESDDFATFSYR